MQKRSRFRIEYSRIGLNPQLPILTSDRFEQMDRPITYLHTHECLELGYCYSGSGVFVVGDKVLPFSAGDVSFINHTEPHLARSAPGTSSHWRWIYVDPMQLVNLPAVDLERLDPTPLAGPDFANILTAQASPHAARIVLRIIEELQLRQDGYADCLRALTWEFMTLLHRQRTPAKIATPSRAQYDRIAPALQYISQHYADPVDIDLLAASCRTSPPHFRRIFLQTIGRPPRLYWHDLRMRMAASLLRTTSRPILQISYDVGFASLSSFNRMFHTAFGMPPREWRKKGE